MGRTHVVRTCVSNGHSMSSYQENFLKVFKSGGFVIVASVSLVTFCGTRLCSVYECLLLCSAIIMFIKNPLKFLITLLPLLHYLPLKENMLYGYQACIKILLETDIVDKKDKRLFLSLCICVRTRTYVIILIARQPTKKGTTHKPANRIADFSSW